MWIQLSSVNVFDRLFWQVDIVTKQCTNFVKSDKNILVNLDKIQSLDLHTSSIIFKDGNECHVSKLYLGKFRNNIHVSTP
ncbi:LytTR family transcriptional regulator DNA-binding domain-containing protein [Lactiplantibacillus brownii]|uniref:LytTR family transcriptional regulator DNA-binding domain-containing protein n=1 Tax=Lactiplantibacillus brownii TaxID=3069269 RepID=UPI00389925FD